MRTNQSKRLALYLPSLRGGGAERVMVTLANGFFESGYEVDLVLAKAEGPYLDDVSEGVRVVDLKASRVIASLPGLVRYLRRERPVAMLAAMGHANVVAVVARSLARVPTQVVLSEHNNFSISMKTARSLRERTMLWFMRWAYPHAEGIVAVSCGVADDLAPNLGMPRSSIDVVYNPVVTDELYRRAEKPAEHPWLKLGEPPVILSVGRLEPQKDFSTLLNAFAMIRQNHEVRLMILGEGSLRSALEAEVNCLGLGESVQFPGFVGNPYPVMRGSSLFVLSSAWEGFGNVLVEAMACGTPVVSTNCPSGPAEILEDGHWGRLVPVGDAVALAKAMVVTLGESEHPDVATRAAEFCVERAIDGYLDIMLPAKTKRQTRT